MNYLFLALAIVLLILLADLLSIFFKLGMRGIARGYRFLFLGTGYRKESFSSETDLKEKVLILGDSTVFGPGADLTETLAARLATKYDLSITNLAKNGDRVSEIISQLDKAEGRRFALALVFAGNNDIWKFTDLKKLKSDISLLLNEVKAVSDKVVLFRGGNIGNCPFFPVTLSRIYTYRSRKVRDMFKEIAQEKGVIYVEKWMERKDDIFLKDPQRFYSWDMLHLNGEGFRVWFDYLEEKMKEGGIRLPVKP